MTKKLIALFLALTMIFAFAACNKDDNTPSGDGGNTPCTSHTDADGNKLCDACGADLTPPCTAHTDANLDNKCDTCGTAVEATVEWYEQKDIYLLLFPYNNVVLKDDIAICVSSCR